jgi:YHS domain-containing protein
MIRVLLLLLILAIGGLTVFVLLGRLLGRFASLFVKPGTPQAWSWSWHVGGGPPGQPRPPTQSLIEGRMARDPLCGMFVSTEVSQRLTEQGTTLHFCSPECLERYRKESAPS